MELLKYKTISTTEENEIIKIFVEELFNVN